MQGQTVHIVFQAIRYIEDHLNDKLELDIVAAALHYSKFHLHRIFTKTGVWLAIPIAELLTLMLTIYLIFRHRKYYQYL